MFYRKPENDKCWYNIRQLRDLLRINNESVGRSVALPNILWPLGN